MFLWHGWLLNDDCLQKQNEEHTNKCDDWTEDYFVWKNLVVPKAEVIYTSSIFTLASIIWIPLCVLLSIVLISKFLICVLRKNEEISLSLISQKLFVEYNSKRFSYILPSIYIFIYFRVKDFVAKYLIYSSCKFYPLCICNVHCNNFKCICIMGTKSQNLVYSLVILSKVSLIWHVTGCPR